MDNYLDFIKKTIYSPYTIIILFLILLLIRILYLDADPYFLKRVGDIGDEGYWAYNARNAILFNTWIIDDFNQALATAPLFSLTVFTSFKLLGTGYFQLRIVSALAGWLTLVVLYFFIKDVWTKKAALVALVILGFNTVFIMFNRLGMVESLMIFFLILSFYLWYKGNKNNIFYILSGICFSFAILTKITAFYIIPALLILWMFEKAMNILQIKNIAYFILSGAIPVSIYFIFLLIPYWAKLSPFLMSVSGKQNLLTLTGGVFNFPFNTFFGFPPVFLLLIPLILYLVNLLTKNRDGRIAFSNIKNTLINMNYMEIVALSWLIGGFIGLLFSDLSERRFLIFFIPLTIIFTKILVDRYTFDLNKIIWKLINIITEKNIITKIIAAFLVILPIFSFLMNMAVVYSIFPTNSYVLLKISLILAMLCSITFFILTYLTTFKVRYTLALVVLLSLGCILALPSLRLVENIIFYFQGFTGISLNNSLIYTILLLCLFFYLFFAFIWRKNLLKITPKFIGSFFIIYLLFNFSVIGVEMSDPTFTLSENSKYINNLEKGAVITGPWSHELSLENGMFPLWYLPDDPQFKTINSDISKYHPKYLLICKVFDDNKKADLNSPYAGLDNYPNVKFIKKMEMYPYPYTKNYRVVLFLYEIN